MEKKIEICSNALLFLGHRPISSFDEPGSGPLLSKNLWEPTYRNFLSINPWSFTKKYQGLNRLATAPTNPRWTYQYQIPSDFIRIDSTVPISDYEIFEDKILSDHQDLGLEYYYMIKEELLPPYAVRALEYNMASVLAIPLTVDTAKAQLYASLYNQQLQVAMSTDAQSQPPRGFASTPTTDSRYF